MHLLVNKALGHFGLQLLLDLIYNYITRLYENDIINHTHNDVLHFVY